MSPTRPSHASLFKFTFAHLPEPTSKSGERTAAPFGECATLKIFGFFDILRVEELGAPESPRADAPKIPNSDPEQVSADRLQRTLLAFGDSKRVTEILANGRDKTNPAYVAVCLAKLAGGAAHGNFHVFCEALAEHDRSGMAHLTCLDAPDVIVLKTFGGKDDAEKQPLQRLIEWMAEIGRAGYLSGKVDRSLTMVACLDTAAFDDHLAPLDADSSARALVRITDMRNGVALRDLYQRIKDGKRFTEIPGLLQASVGYYDVQAIIPVPAAACLLRLAAPMVQDRQLMTSTCFLAEHTPGLIVESVGDKHDMLNSLKSEWQILDKALQWRQDNDCLKSSTRTVAAEAVTRFQRLHTTGFIPGSRLLIWTCRDALRAFAEECEDNRFFRDQEKNPAAFDSEFYIRQSVYGDLFRAVCDELDRRVSLSLAAHTRFFPCSIEVPLKIIGALDMIGRLMAASSRCYRCRERTGLLQVFTAKSDKPSEYRIVSGTEVFRKSLDPVPTVMITTFSPRMVRNFYFAMFTVMHEVAQCVYKETIEWPSFSALVMSHAFVERMAVLGTLASLRSDAPAQVEVPKFVHQWTAEFLAREVLDERWHLEKTRVGPDYFAVPGAAIPEGWGPKRWSDSGGRVWQTQVGRWRVSHEDPATDAGATECHRLFRDARSYPALSQSLKSVALQELWLQELLVQFGSLPEEIASGAVDPLGKLMTYSSKMVDLKSASEKWSGACAWDEYVELASFIPMLRLFEEDADDRDLLETIKGLVCDCAEVWRDSESPSIAFDFARRFLVALAAMDIFRAHMRGEGINDPCLGSSADETIAKALQRGAAGLEECITGMRHGHTRSACSQVWQYVRQPPSEPLMAQFAYGCEVAHPMIIHAMVRFLVRLLHVYSIKGLNIREDTIPAMKELNRHLRRILASRKEPGSERIPVQHVTELWALQYRLSELKPEINYLFSLDDAMKAAGWQPASV